MPPAVTVLNTEIYLFSVRVAMNCFGYHFIYVVTLFKVAQGISKNVSALQGLIKTGITLHKKEGWIDPSYKSHNSSHIYPTMHQFVTGMCTHVHISVTKWCIVRYWTVELWGLLKLYRDRYHTGCLSIRSCNIYDHNHNGNCKPAMNLIVVRNTVLPITFQRVILVIPPLHRGCYLCASIVRPQNWPGRRWRQKGGRTIALVVQGWHIGRSDIAMDAMVAVKFWTCSKQSHKGRRGGRSLTGRSKEAGWRHTHRHGRRMDAQWSAIGRPVKNANIVYQFERHVCLPCTTIVPPLADQWRPLSDHCGDHCASIQRPRQHLSHNGNGSAFTLPSLRDL